MKELKNVNVPKSEDYNIEDEYKAALGRMPELKRYFPHYDEFRYTPPRDYFWEVYNSLDTKKAEEIIDGINTKAKKPPVIQQVITMRKDLLEEIEQSEIINCKPHSCPSETRKNHLHAQRLLRHPIPATKTR